jgi:hypothetical protein
MSVKKGMGIVGVILILVLSVSLISSAGFWNNLFNFGDDNKNLGGELGNTAARLKIADNSPPIIVYVSNVSANLGSSNFIKLYSKGQDTAAGFWFLAQQGGNQAGNLANAALTESSAIFTRAGELSRANLSCTSLPNPVNCGGFCVGMAMNFSCIVYMHYYDGNGTWNINATVEDANSMRSSNLTKTFEVDKTFAAQALTTYLNWTNPVLDTSVTNRYSDNNITIENTGNVPYPNVFVNATDLIGVTTSSEQINSSNFRANNCTGAIASAPLVKNTNIAVSAFIAARSVSDSGRITPLPFCINAVTGSVSISSQDYNASRTWVLTTAQS